MSSLEPLLRDGGTDFERQLLSAVRGERPSARQRARMLRGIGLSSGVALWAATAHAVVASATGKVVIGLGAAAIISLGALPLARERAAARSAVVPTVTAPVVAVVPDPAPSAAQPVSEVIEPAAVAEPARDAANELRAQIELLDAVKHAVNRKDGGEALELLARFDERFPQGVLRSEARTLRRAASRLSSGRNR